MGLSSLLPRDVASAGTTSGPCRLTRQGPRRMASLRRALLAPSLYGEEPQPHEVRLTQGLCGRGDLGLCRSRMLLSGFLLELGFGDAPCLRCPRRSVGGVGPALVGCKAGSQGTFVRVHWVLLPSSVWPGVMPAACQQQALGLPPPAQSPPSSGARKVSARKALPMETPGTSQHHFMTTREVAALIRKTPHAVRQIRHRGTGPSRGRKVGRGILYPRAAVMEWLDRLEQSDPLSMRQR